MKKLMIEVGDNAYPCRLTMGAILFFKHNTDKDVAQLENGNLEEMLMLMWCCMKSASRANGMEMDIDFDLFCDLLSPKDIAKWNAMMSEANQEAEKS